MEWGVNKTEIENERSNAVDDRLKKRYCCNILILLAIYFIYWAIKKN